MPPSFELSVDLTGVRYLVDANVLSEASRRHAVPEVVKWARAHEPEFVIDPIIRGELEFGVLRLDDTHPDRAPLLDWLQGIGRLTCLPFTDETAAEWARLLARLERQGRKMPIKDSLIAATALRYGLIVVTRNVKDFEKAGVKVFNPFPS